MHAWRTLLDTATGLLATLDQELQAEHGLSLAEYEVLVVVSEQGEEGLRMQDLAGTLHLSASGATRRVDAHGAPRLRRAPAVPDRPARFLRRPHRGRVRPASAKPRPPTCAACASTSSTACRTASSRAWPTRLGVDRDQPGRGARRVRQPLTRGCSVQSPARCAPPRLARAVARAVSWFRCHSMSSSTSCHAAFEHLVRLQREAVRL